MKGTKMNKLGNQINNKTVYMTISGAIVAGLVF